MNVVMTRKKWDVYAAHSWSYPSFNVLHGYRGSTLRIK